MNMPTLTVAGLMTVSQVAELRGKTASRIRQLVSSGEMPGRQFGKVWLIHRRHAEAFVFKPRGRVPKAS